MGDFMIKVLAWAFYGALFVGLIGFIIWAVRGLGTMFTPRDRVKIYFDDTDHSKVYYYYGKPGDTYPVGYPKEKIIEEMETFERLKREQKAKSRGKNIEEIGSSKKKPRAMWLQILMMTPSEYKEYRRRRKEATMR